MAPGISASVHAVATGTTFGIAQSWIIVGAVFVCAVLLYSGALFIRFQTSKPGLVIAYTDLSNRDLRIDLLRGVALTFVLVDHLGWSSIFQGVTQEAIGPVSGAEFFVLFSGIVLAVAYRPKLDNGLIGEVTLRLITRAKKLYFIALIVVVAVYLLSLLPFVSATDLMTFTDEGTGSAGSGAVGTVRNLYPNINLLLEYPIVAWIIPQILLLELGPWQFNVIGLYVVLTLAAPLVLWALARKLWLAVIASSALVYFIQAMAPQRILPSQFEDSFPLLTWQVLFVVGLVLGYHRRAVITWFGSRAGLVTLGMIVLLAISFMLFSWTSPEFKSPADFRLSFLSANTFHMIYAKFFYRTTLGLGRLVDVFFVAIAVYSLTSVYWKPIARAVGWYFVPLGQSSLSVFVIHVLLALLAPNIPGLITENIWANSALYLVVLGLVWFVVKKRSAIPLILR